MILKFKYHGDTGLLEAYQSYILAQNSSMSDTVVITSTASDAGKYDYCLEFVCYNSKNIPKAQYISPILKYEDGITFTLPNNLTEYKGHVDMQLTGYLPEDNSVVFKSIAKNCKAFDVEGSLNVLESDLGETPNVLTEVMKQLDELNNVHEEIVENARDEFEGICNQRLKVAEFHRVRFYAFAELFKECYVMDGGTVTAPDMSNLSEELDTDGNWYNDGNREIYSADLKITHNYDFVYNFYSKGISVNSSGFITGYTPYNSEIKQLILPECFEGRTVSGFDAFADDLEITGITELYIPSTFSDQCDLYKLKGAIENVYVNPCNKTLKVYDNVVYSDTQLIYYPSGKKDKVYTVRNNIAEIFTGAIKNNAYLETLIVPEGVRIIYTDGIAFNSALSYVILPRSITALYTGCIHDNADGMTIYFAGDVTEFTTLTTFGSEKNYKIATSFEHAKSYSKKFGTYGIPCTTPGYDTMTEIFVTRYE